MHVRTDTHCKGHKHNVGASRSSARLDDPHTLHTRCLLCKALLLTLLLLSVRVALSAVVVHVGVTQGCVPQSSHTQRLCACARLDGHHSHSVLRTRRRTWDTPPSELLQFTACSTAQCNGRRHEAQSGTTNQTNATSARPLSARDSMTHTPTECCARAVARGTRRCSDFFF